MATGWLESVVRQQMRDSGPFTGGPAKGVLHTTESPGFPTYRDGAVAPHFTIKTDADAKTIVVRQHVPLNLAARALRNEPGGVQTNRDSAIQIELVGTCSPTAVGMYYWPRADDWALSALAAFMRTVEAATGIKRRAVDRWVAYPLSFGTDAAQRMSLSQWDAWNGWCGHQHVPENSHGDPGALNVDRLIGYTETPKPVRPPVAANPTFPLASNEFYGEHHRNGYASAIDRRNIRVWQAQMRSRGWTLDVDGLFGAETKGVLVAFQQEKHLPVDGLLGRRSWEATWTRPVT